jgi:hypothetical protein
MDRNKLKWVAKESELKQASKSNRFNSALLWYCQGAAAVAVASALR